MFGGEAPPGAIVDEHGVEKFRLGQGYGVSDEIDLHIEDSTQFGAAMQFAPEIAMLFVECQQGGHLVTFGIPTYCRGREHQAGDDPYALDDVEPVELNEHLYFSHHRSISRFEP